MGTDGTIGDVRTVETQLCRNLSAYKETREGGAVGAPQLLIGEWKMETSECHKLFFGARKRRLSSKEISTDRGGMKNTVGEEINAKFHFQDLGV